MPGPEYSELANWDGRLSGTQPSSRNLEEGVSSTSNLNGANFDTANALLALSNTMEDVRLKSESLGSVAEGSASRIAVDMTQPDSSVSVHPTKKSGEMSSLPISNATDNSTTSWAENLMFGSRTNVSLPGTPITSRVDVARASPTLLPSLAIDAPTRKKPNDSTNIRAIKDLTISIETIPNVGRVRGDELSSIALTDNDAEGSTDDGRICEDEDDIAAMLSFPESSLSPQRPISSRPSQTQQTSTTTRPSPLTVSSPLPPLTPPCRSRSTSPSSASKTKKRQFLSYIQIPPLPPNVDRRDYKGPTYVQRVKPSKRGQAKSKTSFATVGEALKSALKTNGKNAFQPVASGSGVVNRKHTRQEHGSENEDWIPERKKRRLPPAKSKLRNSEVSPSARPTLFSGECLHSFDLDMDDIILPHYTTIISSLRHVLSPSQLQLCLSKCSDQNDISRPLSLETTRCRSIFPELGEDGDDDDGLQELVVESASLAGKQRGRPKNKAKRIWHVESVSPHRDSPAGNRRRIPPGSDPDVNIAKEGSRSSSTRVDKGKAKDVEGNATPTSRPRAQRTKPPITVSPSPNVELDMDQYFHGLGDQMSASPLVSPSRRRANTKHSSIKPISHMDLYSSPKADSTIGITTATPMGMISPRHDAANDTNAENNVRAVQDFESADDSFPGMSKYLSPPHETTAVPTSQELPSVHLPIDEADTDALYDDEEVRSPWSLHGHGKDSPMDSGDSATEYIGDGTIDPSLLGGIGESPVLSPSPSISRSPSPPPRRGTLAQKARAVVNGDASPSQSPDKASTVFNSSPARRRTSSQRVFRRRNYSDYVAADDLDLSSDSTESDAFVSPSSKSFAKKSAETNPISSTNSYDAQSDTRLDVQSSRASPADSLTQDELTCCHQCRRKTNRKKMECSSKGVKPCTKRYCWGCIERYPDITFDSTVKNFICPACLSNCNCDICCEKRGVRYIGPRRRGRVRRVGEVTRRTQRITKAVQDTGTTTNMSTQSYFAKAPPPDMRYWATVYDLNGKPMATAFAGDNSEQVIVAQTTNASTSKRDRNTRVFVGRAQNWWGPGSADQVDRQLEEQSSSVSTGKGKGKASAPSARTYIGKLPPLLAPPRSAPSELSPPPPPLVPPAPAPPVPAPAPAPFSPSMDSLTPMSIADATEYYDWPQFDGEQAEYGQTDAHEQSGWRLVDDMTLTVQPLDASDLVKAIQAGLTAVQPQPQSYLLD